MARKSKGSKKRSSQKIQNALQIAERAENGYNDSEGSDNDGDDLQVHDGIMDASRFLGKKGQEGDNFDDEELDSDEALGSDDDFDVLNSKFSQTIRDKEKKRKQKAKQRKRGYQQSEKSESEEEEYNSVDESEFIPLSEAWDLDDKDVSRSSKASKNQDIQLDDNWETESSEEDDEEDDEEEEDDDDESEEGSEAEESDEDIFNTADEGENDDIDLTNTVSRLQSQLKKPAKERKRLVTETTEENEYNIPTSGNKLSLNDMISAVDSSISKDAILIDEDPEKSKALAVPLPKNIQERHDRKVAYNITKDQVSKWQKTVEANLDAEVLKFPMNQTSQPNTTANTFKPDEEPATELESKIQNLLKESALADDKNEATFEEIATAKLSKEEMRKRTNELRMMRELMFRDERRAKRIKKIKSKQYHKIKKKERLRNQELVEGSDMESDPEDHDMKRAEERMNLKHKTQSKWAQSMIKTGLSKDASNRGELEEMLRQGERLRAKQLGYEDGDQSDGGASDIEKEYEKDDDHEERDDVKRHKLGKGVLAMDFMKAAEAKQREENIKEIENLRKLENGEDIDEFSNGNTSVGQRKNQGRRVYGGDSAEMKAEMDALDQHTRNEIKLDNAKSLDKKLSKKYTVAGDVEVVPNNDSDVEDDSSSKQDNNSNDDELNPWITASNEPTQKSSKIHAIDKDSSRLSKSAAKISKHSKKRSAADREREDDNIISLEETLHVNKGGVNDSDSDVDDDEANNGEIRMFQQKNLIKEAFAGDDVVQEFENEKKHVIEDEGDKEEDVTLPGWGDWAGEGIKKRKKNKFVRKIDGVVQENRRKDKDKEDVIINEKVNKKNLKYQSGAVPYPFETREQYERSLRMPIGQQWTSKETHQRMSMPRVITKQGTVIDPLKAPFK